MDGIDGRSEMGSDVAEGVSLWREARAFADLTGPKPDGFGYDAEGEAKGGGLRA